MSEIMLYFPDYCNLSPVRCESPVPRVGDNIFLETRELFSDINDSHDYRKHGNKWVVKSVDFSCKVWANPGAEFKRRQDSIVMFPDGKLLGGCKSNESKEFPKNKVTVEVSLEKAE